MGPSSHVGEAPVALVTGASSGIGRAIAKELARQGHRVAVSARRSNQLESLRDEIETEGGAAFTQSGDMTSTAEVEAVVDAAVDRWGRLDVVVHSAGVEVLGDVASLSETDWRTCIDVNLTSAFLVAHYSVPHLVKQQSSAFVAIGSDASVAGAQGFAAYGAAKHGLVGLIRCMAVDYGHQGLRSNIVCPSYVETPMLDRLMEGVDPGERAYWESAIPLLRFARADEVAKAVCHLAGPQASYTNGMVYNLDGGATAGYWFPHLALGTAYPRPPAA
jgi:meso-butanediol dehydrogenase / (S,S)-butanediol dehydrogenase / diacetyl reductase